MTIQMLKGKIHRAVVVQAELNYVGSITVDPVLSMRRFRSSMWKMAAVLRPTQSPESRAAV